MDVLEKGSTPADSGTAHLEDTLICPNITRPLSAQQTPRVLFCSRTMQLQFVPLLLCALLIGQCSGARLDRWVRTGLQFLRLNLCRRVPLPDAECKRLSHLPPSGVLVYLSQSVSGKVMAILPDSDSSGELQSKLGGFGEDEEKSRTNEERYPGASAHDAVLVLDPSPRESFGHPLLLFYVDFNMTKKKCAHMDGIFLGEECLMLAVKTRCQNQLKRRRSRSDRFRVRRSTLSRMHRLEHSSALCEVHFLPLVVAVKDTNRTQRLHCVDHPDFARCPEPLPQTSPRVPISSCELSKNTRRCHQQRLATHLSCRLYQTCDHAVLLSGGWQEQITYQQHVQKLQLFHQMLRNNGFHGENIKTFFAGSGQVAVKEMEGMYPATEKEVIRNHISYICRKPNCVDSLVLYLNSPTRNDGTMLLWDRNNNGILEFSRIAATRLYFHHQAPAGCSFEGAEGNLTFQEAQRGQMNKKRQGKERGADCTVEKIRDRLSWDKANSLIPRRGSGDKEGLESQGPHRPGRCSASMGKILIPSSNRKNQVPKRFLLQLARAEVKERYSVAELLADLAGCKASRVLLFVEQSYSGVLSKRLMGSLKHLNVALLSGLPWLHTAHFWAPLHPSQCLIDHLSKQSPVTGRLRDSTQGLLNVTLAGAPCNSTPALTDAEMKKEYMGCQNLPTALWYQKRPKTHDGRN
ncbi:hypothetical protein DNTS_033095 [Danionella cerebrum]|uniref:Uncharacterized protein n=1 Tax=Danionella cerebrum TaxID=2873325 RepID=A0A553N5V0_9TELE|nr:hypothetical protein DNTS_033095 [Danionella translucida]